MFPLLKFFAIVDLGVRLFKHLVNWNGHFEQVWHLEMMKNCDLLPDFFQSR